MFAYGLGMRIHIRFQPAPVLRPTEGEVFRDPSKETKVGMMATPSESRGRVCFVFAVPLFVAVQEHQKEAIICGWVGGDSPRKAFVVRIPAGSVLVLNRPILV